VHSLYIVESQHQICLFSHILNFYYAWLRTLPKTVDDPCIISILLLSLRVLYLYDFFSPPFTFDLCTNTCYIGANRLCVSLGWWRPTKFVPLCWVCGWRGWP
jgi:hypothetical protein